MSKEAIYGFCGELGRASLQRGLQCSVAKVLGSKKLESHKRWLNLCAEQKIALTKAW